MTTRRRVSISPPDVAAPLVTVTETAVTGPSRHGHGGAGQSWRYPRAREIRPFRYRGRRALKSDIRSMLLWTTPWLPLMTPFLGPDLSHSVRDPEPSVSSTAFKLPLPDS